MHLLHSWFSHCELQSLQRHHSCDAGFVLSSHVHAVPLPTLVLVRSQAWEQRSRRVCRLLGLILRLLFLSLTLLNPHSPASSSSSSSSSSVDGSSKSPQPPVSGSNDDVKTAGIGAGGKGNTSKGRPAGGKKQSAASAAVMGSKGDASISAAAAAGKATESSSTREAGGSESGRGVAASDGRREQLHEEWSAVMAELEAVTAEVCPCMGGEGRSKGTAAGPCINCRIDRLPLSLFAAAHGIERCLHARQSLRATGTGGSHEGANTTPAAAAAATDSKAVPDTTSSSAGSGNRQESPQQLLVAAREALLSFASSFEGAVQQLVDGAVGEESSSAAAGGTEGEGRRGGAASISNASFLVDHVGRLASGPLCWASLLLLQWMRAEGSGGGKSGRRGASDASVLDGIREELEPVTARIAASLSAVASALERHGEWLGSPEQVPIMLALALGNDSEACTVGQEGRGTGTMSSGMEAVASALASFLAESESSEGGKQGKAEQQWGLKHACADIVASQRDAVQGVAAVVKRLQALLPC